MKSWSRRRAQLHLGGAEFENERFVGESHRYLKEFRLDHRIAVWTFELDDVVFEKSIVMPHNQNTVCVQYRLLQRRALEPAGAAVRVVSPARRDRRRARRAMRSSLEVRRGRHEIRHASSPLVLRMALQPGPTTFVTDERDEHQFMYRIERDRGDPAFDSAFSPGYFAAQLSTPTGRSCSSPRRMPGSAWISTPRPSSMPSAAAWTACSRSRRSCSDDPFAEQLAMAADQFIVLPGSRLEENVMAQAEGSELRSIYAGYHWFGDWGRDTMISLEGLTLVHRPLSRGRRDPAYVFALRAATACCRTCFPKASAQALYHTVDATLWYFHAISRYVEATGDRVDPARSCFRCCSRSSSITSPARASTSTSIPPTA